MTAEAREAFSHGWALSHGPMTDTVRAAYLVACQHVAEHGPTEQALEAAVDLGSMSGTWALILARRETVYADQLAAIVSAWRKLARRADLKAAVHQVRHNLGELADPERQRRTAAAAAAAVLALHLLVDQNDPDWQAFVNALATGMTVAQAEGVAGAIGVAAEQAGISGIDFQLAYDDAYATITLDSYAARQAAAAILRGATTDLTNALAAGIRDELPPDEMVALAADSIGLDDSGDGEDGGDGGDSSAASLLGDTALSRSFLSGMIGWFAAQGVRQVNFVTTAGACQRCEDIAAQNPWNAYEVPTPQIHPHCRCSLENVDPVVGFDFTRYL